MRARRVVGRTDGRGHRSPRIRRGFRAWLAAGLLVLAGSGSARAALLDCTAIGFPGCVCGITVGGISYGARAANQLAADPDRSGVLQLACQARGLTLLGSLLALQVRIPYRISLGPASVSRALVNTARPTARVPYQIYQDAARTRVWGTESEGRSLAGVLDLDVSAGLLGLVMINAQATDALGVHLRLQPNGTSMPPGLYTDTVTVTVSY